MPELTPKVRILFIHQDGAISGSAISLATLIRALPKDTYRPVVICGADGRAVSLFKEVAEDVRVVPMKYFTTRPSPKLPSPQYFRNLCGLRYNKGIEEAIRGINPDLVHINDKASLQAGKAVLKFDIPVVWHLRSTYHSGGSFFQNLLSRRIIEKAASHVIAISRDELEGFDRKVDHSIIHNSIDLKVADHAIVKANETRKTLGFSDGDFVIAAVGLLNDQKGAWEFIRAAGMLKKARPDVQFRFVFVAPIPDRKSLYWGWRGALGLIDTRHPQDRALALAKEVGIEEEFSITGFVENVLGYIAAVDVVTACFNMMAVGRPAFEAMAVGKPVVVNEGHSGMSDVVIHDKTGLVVPIRNERALARQLQRLVDDPSLRTRLAIAGHQHSRQKFDAERNARLVHNIYSQLRSGTLAPSAIPRHPSS